MLVPGQDHFGSFLVLVFRQRQFASAKGCKDGPTEAFHIHHRNTGRIFLKPFMTTSARPVPYRSKSKGPNGYYITILAYYLARLLDVFSEVPCVHDVPSPYSSAHPSLPIFITNNLSNS